MNFKKENSLCENQFIEEHFPFIIKSISKITKRYVSIENDEEFSIGVLAFHEAMKKHSEEKGPFLPFANLVISSRVKNYLMRENKYRLNPSLEKLKEEGIDFGEEVTSPVEDQNHLKEEIQNLKLYIDEFGFTFEDLVDDAPKHKKTRENAINLSQKVSKEKTLVDFMYEKKRLPIKKICLQFNITEKIIKGSKKFIITVIIIFDKNFRNLKLWIKR
ncbi:MAG: RNA polymerase subunit sigma [Terrisporobacter sp.]|uniref:hypothetical protein n=1 Tax=Terrisporobacter sp. TaxID=1965305 RepID=UPI002FCB4995